MDRPVPAAPGAGGAGGAGGAARPCAAPVPGGAAELLCSCVSLGHSGCVEALVAGGADVNARGRGGFTPLMVAASCDRRSIAELLVRSGAELEAYEEHFGHTALSLACAWLHVSVARVLAGAGAVARDGLVMDALLAVVRCEDAARFSRGVETIEFILSLGLDVDAALGPGVFRVLREALPRDRADRLLCAFVDFGMDCRSAGERGAGLARAVHSRHKKRRARARAETRR
jgi:hypothetical protein